MGQDATPSPAGTKVGIWELSPGIERSNFFSLLGAAFFSIGVLTLVGNLRPYLFNSMLAIPDDVQGRVSDLRAANLCGLAWGHGW